MASLSTNKTNGTRSIQYKGRDGRRHTIRLGTIDARAAEAVRRHVDNLESAIAHGQPVPRETMAWAAILPDKLHARLSLGKLVEARRPLGSTQIAKVLDAYLVKRRLDLKKNTVENLRQVRNGLVDHFTETRDVRTITRGEMNDWHRGLKAHGYAGPTVAMHVKKARQFFADAVDRGLMAENPAKGIKAGSMVNRDRFHYVPAAVIETVIAACPDKEWAAIFALARYACLRVPSETRGLRWADVDWQGGRMTVRSPKTERHAGKAKRIVPITPALLPHLRDAFEVAGEGAVHVVARHRGDNLGTMAAKIIDRAGVAGWVKTFQNLRSSCETDWTAQFPIHVACAWAGNTEAVARDHYLQITENHFAAAAAGVKSGAGTADVSPDNSRTPGVYQSQNPAGWRGLAGTNYPQGGQTDPSYSPENQRIARRVMQKAMRRLKAASPHFYKAQMRAIHGRGGAR